MSNKAETLLIVEDDKGLQTQLKWHFSDYQVVVAANQKDAIAAIRLHEPKVMIQDLGLPPDEDGVKEGFELLQQALHLNPHMKIIVMTGNEGNQHAMEAIKLGSYDFYAKPVDPDTLDLIVQRAFHIHHLEEKNRNSSQQQESMLHGLIASDEKMLKICKMIEKIAPTDTSCLLLGDSGTGKEVLANSLHQLSQRKEHSIVAINCAAIPENLIESELFGYEKGAFTGAVKTTIGKIEQAHKGTLFLDEIGDMPLHLQAKLLRFLQERVIERVGGRTNIPIDTRIVCATHKNLDEMIQNGEFREDLFYRIAEIQIDIPALKDRGSDKILLAKYLLNKFVKKQKLNIIGFSEDAVNAIENHSWPGNVREMENKIKRATIMCDLKYISAQDLGLSNKENSALNLKEIRKNAEVNALKQALIACDHNISAAAKSLGITRPTLYDLMKKYNMS
ncbi:PEP-CTERM-box response regulator transcription factor [Psychromonas sp. psych-6C06]|uniref:PEP-CTERM-box response regulator transcription factor n=1 Tax=Psychromonas sp. psych-6C06 TaxID=2058089 RepID=UPI000C329FAE|nr:PEP-CTERM-box response regulator transcription factor [Psychromonas sp. psych-6C06]PKF61423.1 PEP-CTERM-box response regulator transcription factor [Psychromonas sp. psych-6C06]